MRIPSTKPFLPPAEAYEAKVREIWKNGWLTNHGPLVQAFEDRISKFLKVDFVSYVSSGTTGLQLALRSLAGKGEVITTPFSYVATASAPFWEGLTPVFGDIHPNTWTLDPEKVKELISTRTTAIFATHVYGNACHIEELEKIARENNLVLIYDAAHSFGSGYKGKSLCSFGDASVLSFHATKAFHTVCGGLVVSKSKEAKEKIDRLRNFGHTGTNTFDGPGINGKGSEFHAAMGLLNLDFAEEILSRRKAQWNLYYHELSPNEKFTFPLIENFGDHNGMYFPVAFKDASLTAEIIEKAASRGIELRRYFAPALNLLDFVEYRPCPIAESLASRVVCLPLYHEMLPAEQREVIELLNE